MAATERRMHEAVAAEIRRRSQAKSVEERRIWVMLAVTARRRSRATAVASQRMGTMSRALLRSLGKD